MIWEKRVGRAHKEANGGVEGSGVLHTATSKYPDAASICFHAGRHPLTSKYLEFASVDPQNRAQPRHIKVPRYRPNSELDRV
jgi:hypothetical protein